MHPITRLAGRWVLVQIESLAVAQTTTMSNALPDFDAMWDFNDPAATEQKFRDLLARPEVAANPAYHLQLLTQLARTQGLANRFGEGHATLDQVERQLAPQFVLVRVRYLLERGRLFNSSGDGERAVPLFDEAFKIASAGNSLDYHAIDAAHMLGIVSATPRLQLEWNHKALAASEKSTDPRAKRWAGALYNNMGWTYFDDRQYDKAIELFQKGVQFRADVKQPRELRIAKYAVARTLRAKGRIDEALTLIQSIYDESITAGDRAGFIHEEYAECLLAAGREQQAMPVFRSAHELLSKDQWLVKNEPDRLSRLARHGQQAAE